jgi:chemotaxis protein CheY-P-specific phosphatase CheC
MNDFLNDEELQTASSLLNVALANAAESFSKLANQQVYLQSVEITKEFSELPILQLDKYADLPFVYLLTTEIKGEMHAESYLIFSPEESSEMAKIGLPVPLLDSEEMQHALLLEIDNILTASFITQFSNFLGKSFYGYVPEITQLSAKATQEFITERKKHYAVTISLKTNFITEFSAIYPVFIWHFNYSFIEAIKEFSQNEQALEKLATLHKTCDKYIR